MEKNTLTIKYQVCHINELTSSDYELVKLAQESTYRSYAPYSRFHVGAALRLSNNTVVCGSNQENAAFGAGTCAERCTLFHAHDKYPDCAVISIAIAARGTDEQFTEKPIAPCGICRQALLEAQTRAKGTKIRALLCGKDEVVIVKSINDLLPFAFDTIL